jgi:hypothetical protein
MNRSVLLLAASLACLASVAWAGAPPRPVKIVDEAVSRKDWAPVQPQMRAPTPAGEAHDVCVALGFKINRDGSTSDVVLLMGRIDGQDAGQDPRLTPYAQAAAAAVGSWRFEATPDASSNRVMFTSGSVAFARPGGPGEQAVREQCVISDLKGFIAKAQEADGNGPQAELERRRRAELDAATKRTSSRFTQD